MKKILIGVLAIVIVVGGIAITQQSQTDSNDVVRTGAALAFTGDFAFVGEEFRRGMELALEDHADANMEIIYEDDKSFDITETVNAVNKLIHLDNVDIVMNTAISTVQAVAPLLNESHVAGFVVWDSGKTVGELGEYVFASGYSTEAGGFAMADFAYEDLSARNVAIVSAKDHWSEEISHAFEERYQAIGGTITVHEQVQLTSNDLRSVVSKVMASNAEAIYVPLYLQSLDAFIRQARELGFEGAIMSPDGFSDVNIQNLGEFAEGVYTTQVWLEDKSLRDRYVARFGDNTNPINLALAGLGYDAVAIVGEVVAELRAEGVEPTSEAIRDGLIGHDFTGVTGEFIFTEEQQYTNKKHSILQVENGGYVLIKE